MRYLPVKTFIRTVVLPFKAEYDTFPMSGGDGFHFDNTLFGSVDAEVLYAVIRHRQPSRVVEIGAGWSTLLIRKALAANGFGVVDSFDPDPPSFLAGVNRQRVGEIGILGPGDILFVDGSHIRSPGSDVDLLFSRILPSLPDGVWVHVHDVFLPDPYPASWSDRGYNEQDHLAAFIEADPRWAVVFSSHHAQKTCPELLVEAFSSYEGTRWPGSFWMRRKS